MQKTAVSLSFFALMGVSMIHPPQLMAQVIINEVHPAPSTGDEWIELKNLGNTLISLQGWTLEDNSGPVTPTPAIANAVFNQTGFTVLEVKNRLNNSGDRVILRAPDGSVADHFEFNSTESDQSWSRVSDDATQFVLSPPTRNATNSASFIATPSPAPTSTPQSSPPTSPLPTHQPTPGISPLPTTYTPAPSPVPASFPLQLSEVMACPHPNEPEWIEFFNPNAVSVSISQWKVKDGSTNSRLLTLTLGPQSFSAVDLSSAILNNDGDALIISDADGHELIRIELPACEKGQSTVFAQGQWQQTQTPTKNLPNVFLPLMSSDDDQLSINIDPTPFQTESFLSSVSGLIVDGSTLNSFQVGDEQLTSASLNALDHEESSLSASESSSVRTSDSQPMESFENGQTSIHTPFFRQKNFLLGLFLTSVFATAIGGFGLYEWYTELHAESVLEDM